MADGGGVVLLTGACGFLGSQIARRLLVDTTCTVIALVHAEDGQTARQRTARGWWEWTDLADAIGQRVEPLAGDVSAPRLGLGDAEFDALARRVTHVVHTAADLRVDAPLDVLRRTNVDGTAHTLELARAAHDDHGLETFAHVSSAYVCGRRRGAIEEDSFTDAFGFSTAYEQSKFESEALVRAARSELPVSIFRPGMVVGDSRTGAVKTFNTFYAPLRLYLSGKLPFVPAARSLRLNIVPVDYVAEAVSRLTFDRRAAGLTFHLVAPTASLPTVGELLEAVRAWAAERLDLRLRRPPCVPLGVPYLPGSAPRGSALKALQVLRPYLADWRTFARNNVDYLVGPYQPAWRDFLPKLLEYAVGHSFLQRSERTIHEQVVYRLSSTRWPVIYHDIDARGTSTRSAREVRREMLAATAALRVLGVGPGDRVAIVGPNSSRYLTLDVAIGLVGATSVPLYTTSPPNEIDALVAASGARLLLIGAPAVLARWAELHISLPTVNFGRTPSPAQADGRILSWAEFLALGAGAGEQPPAPVTFSGLATLRYTSGTTGPPKGVAFDHANLRWMAETMAGLLPWQARTRPARYLSFLPMNHVVEGILATYSAYFLPAAVEIYFLEDFHALAPALRKARPSIFFSVPRVYEKVWQTLAEDRAGRWYLALPGGLRKNLLRLVLRQAVLRKAGFDHCSQVIVGSAAVPEALLESFRELGIEIHNAYGLTEAPLVTLNRPGANRLGTVGEPLPDTQLAIASDGEVLVRGPQVMRGYFGPDLEQPFVDGWLLTGDLGRLTAEGSLVIDGRKKEIIATSYGKKVQPARVETLLRQIPEVTEAMLVGEGRPYCAALLWTAAGESTESISLGVESVNSQLSHAEQIKRWTVLPDDLSIERGDLTPNLKLKRGAVARRFGGVVQRLYEHREPAGTHQDSPVGAAVAR
jgi:long-chain acyl-CoA synthetase